MSYRFIDIIKNDKSIISSSNYEKSSPFYTLSKLNESYDTYEKITNSIEKKNTVSKYCILKYGKLTKLHNLSQYSQNQTYLKVVYVN